MLRYCEGDLSAMEALVQRFYPRLHAFFHRMLAPAEVVDDLIHDTFVRLMEQVSRYQPSGRFSTYLFTIAANLLKDERKRATRRDCSLDDFSPDTYYLNDGACAEDTIADAVERAGMARRVRFALAQLNHDLRVAVILRYYHEFTYEEIARVVGCPPGTAKSRVHHAVRQLRTMLGVEENA